MADTFFSDCFGMESGPNIDFSCSPKGWNIANIVYFLDKAS